MKSGRSKSRPPDAVVEIQIPSPLASRCVLLPPGEGGAERRMRAACPTTLSIFANRGAGFPHPALRDTLSQWERAATKNRSQFWRTSVVELALERIAEKWKHPAEVHYADPQEQRSPCNQLGSQRSILARPKMFYFAERTTRIKDQHVRSGKQDEENLVPEDRVMNVLERIAGKEQRSSAETNRKTGDSKRQQLVQRREWKSFRHPKQLLQQ